MIWRGTRGITDSDRAFEEKQDNDTNATGSEHLCCDKEPITSSPISSREAY